jgi:allantoinase
MISGERVVLPEGIGPAVIHTAGGRIAAIVRAPAQSSARATLARLDAAQTRGVQLIDAGNFVVMPGLVDTHVHVNDPGRAEWEGFDHATRAAAAGGVTTLVDMPLNSIPPTTTVEGFDAKRVAADRRCHVDIGYWGGVVPGNIAAIEPLARAGALGFKCFLTPSGVEEFGHVSESDLRDVLPVLVRLGLPLLVHAELPDRLREPVGPHRRYSTWLESRPPDSEVAAIERMIELSREFGARVHVVHLASADAVPGLAVARRAGIRITVETCPHYLTFAAEDIPDGATAFKCAPPIRSSSHRERLWQGLIDGTIDMVATDHSPAPPSMKCVDSGDVVKAWGGIASLQLGLPVVWTGAAARGVPLERVSAWMSSAPARLAGVDRVKGRIAPGYDADFVIWDPDAETVVDAATLHHRHAVTPYDGMRLRGRVHTTILRGEIAFAHDACVGKPRGQMIRRVVD